MSDAPLRGYNGRHEWFWEPGDEAHIFPLEDLLNMYYKSVGRNSTLILGITPNPDGLVPEPDAKRMREFGDEIVRRFARPIANGSGEVNQLTINLSAPAQINHVIIQEDIAHGERIREYVVEGFGDGQWITLCTGSCVGHKRIQKFPDVKLSRVRLRVLQSIARPIIKNLVIYYVDYGLFR